MLGLIQVTDFVARANQLVDVAAKVMAASKDGIHGMSDAVWMGAFFMPGAFLTVRKYDLGETVLPTCLVVSETQLLNRSYAHGIVPVA